MILSLETLDRLEQRQRDGLLVAHGCSGIVLTEEERNQLVALARKALSTATAPAAPTTWQPIITCPRIPDRLVLLYPSRGWAEDVEPCDCEVGYWDQHAQTWEAFGPTAEDYRGPTHWMPLPCPPTSRESGAP